ncbi:MAG: hypothetical protein ISP90_17205 [Nevskia sp.]|nr:hypothetical protein [Nevskia sp.]
MSVSERFSVATHLYVRLRKSPGRVIDAVWMSQNDEYAREILRLALAERDEETHNLAHKFEGLMGDAPKRRAAPAAAPAAPAAPGAEGEPGQQYVRSLR